jgi:hypothetical protein
MSADDCHGPNHFIALCPSTRPEAPTDPVAPDVEAKSHLLEVEKLIREVLAAPLEGVDSEVVALVRGAMRVQRNFQVSLTLRALKLEQGLRKAQQQVIRLQWELAQLRRCGTVQPSVAFVAED